MSDPARVLGTRAGVMKRFALFDYGFRPFFLLAGLYALVVIPAWLYFFAHHGTSFGSLPLMYWHAHEMIYGFVAAAVAGFLLTAVPSWTGARGFGGKPLVILVALWIAGRIAVASVGEVPFWLTAVGALAFLPGLAVLLAPPLLRSSNRNTPLLGVLGVLWLIDAAFLFALRSGDVALGARALNVAIDLVLVLVTVIGGRIVPAFTANAQRRRGVAADIVSRRWLEFTVIALMIAIAVADVFAAPAALAGALAALAAAAHLVRLSGWRSFKTRSESILWVLHVGYAWLPIGLGLKALWLLGGVSWAIKWQHALTMGVFATMILAVMTRASLGHTGRPLEVSRTITVSYLLLTLGVVLRVFGGALWPDSYLLTVTAAGVAWTLSFLLYVAVYTPILVGPRADGRSG
ncbi:MAG TPA: NnrS family protein [Steroidobacter sp.]|nr:NnrS family protein [Steroidobacteraceae bacterium]HLS81341.1 NnrS family protein [Steroidobacter sp.]